MSESNETKPNQIENLSAEQIIAINIVKKEKATFNETVTRNMSIVDEIRNRIDRLKQNENEEKETYKAERRARQIADAERVLRIREGIIEFTRPPFEKDVEYRLKVIKSFPKKVKETVPDTLPLVFHGTRNIGDVRQIIKTNGLLTPEERGESIISFASQIDVGAKTNIRTPCEFAEPNYYWIPYGAIFSFLPKPEEVEKVNRTADGTEVFGGVNGVNFKQEPERLFGIITSPENIEQVQKWCIEYGLDSSKVMTHDGFLESITNTQTNLSAGP